MQTPPSFVVFLRPPLTGRAGAASPAAVWQLRRMLTASVSAKSHDSGWLRANLNLCVWQPVPERGAKKDAMEKARHAFFFGHRDDLLHAGGPHQQHSEFSNFTNKQKFEKCVTLFAPANLDQASFHLRGWQPASQSTAPKKELMLLGPRPLDPSSSDWLWSSLDDQFKRRLIRGLRYDWVICKNWNPSSLSKSKPKTWA